MFKQLFDDASSTLTYLIVDDNTAHAVIIDPVDTHLDDYIALIESLKCKLKYAIETHVHADHVTASGMLRERLGIKTGVSAVCGAKTADLQLQEGDILTVGKEAIQVIATPGHTLGSLSYLWNDRLFTGDALLINGCGRTDFQGGDAGMLFDSIVQKVFVLPDETLIYPGHDYNGRRVSCVFHEKNSNVRFVGKSREAFITQMAQLNLPKPKLIDLAVPANRVCGVPDLLITQG